jgi:hypothetical protein
MGRKRIRAVNYSIPRLRAQIDKRLNGNAFLIIASQPKRLAKGRNKPMLSGGQIAGSIYMIMSKYMVLIFNMVFLFPLIETAGFLQ